MHRHTILVAGLLAAAPLTAQNIALEVVGGSVPGQVDMGLHGGTPFLGAAIVVSGNPGPTPLSLFDPNDPRSASVGIDLLHISPWGLFWTNGSFEPNPFVVPNSPSLHDLPFFFQGLSFPGNTGLLLGELSNVRVVRLAPAGAFRDRNVSFITNRAFFPVLPRADGSWMAVGGGFGQLLGQLAQSDSEIYDPVTDSISTGPLMNSARSLHTATLLQDGRWLLVAGVDGKNDPQTSCEVYEPQNDQFVPVASLATPRMGHTATLLADGRVLVTGGLSNMSSTVTPLAPIFSAQRSTEIYDPVADSWSPGPPLSTPRAAHFAFTLPGGKVALAGGLSFTFIFPTVRSSMDLFDPATNQMTGGAGMQSPRSFTSAVEIGSGRFLVSGGISQVTLAQPGTPTATAEIFDAALGTWTATALPMATARGNHGVAAMGGGDFLMIGGANGDILNPNALASTEIYHATTDSWSPGPNMTTSRAGFGLFVTPTGQVHIMGGGSGLGASVVKSTEWYYF